MRFLQKFIDFYIQSSLHVAFSALSFVWVTQRFFSVSNGYVASFVFFGTVVGYNFVKYDALVRKRQGAISLRLKAIAVLSAIALVCSGYCFFQMEAAGQYITLGVFLLTLLYTLSFFT
jgi:small-conductance mechanosensitive channel